MVFGLSAISLHGALTASTIPIRQNVVKQLLFRAASLLLQFFVLKAGTLLAWIFKSFTSYLMFSEDPIQRAFFIRSRGISRAGVMVLLLTIFLFIGNWFDALLWTLDSPGYLARKSNVTAGTISDRLLQEPNYLVATISKPGDVTSLDSRLVNTLEAGIFRPGVNFTLTGQFDRGVPKIVPATRTFEEVGPRIWLDDEGFSLSPDTLITVQANLSEGVEPLNCPWQLASKTSQYWNCTFDNSLAMPLTTKNSLGVPQIYWDDASDELGLSQYLLPTREDNPWRTLGTGGDTTAMKQMFTITKGKARHTFIETASKAVMLTPWLTPFSRKEVTDLVRRGWSSDPNRQNDKIVSRIPDFIVGAQEQNASATFGFTTQTETSVSQVNYELLNVESAPGVVLYTLFRFSVVDIKLVRSDTLPDPVTPLEECDAYYANVAIGGKLRGTDCYLRTVGQKSKYGSKFQGQVDTSAFLLFNGILGEGRFNTSAKALNQKGAEWLQENNQKIDDLLLSRGYILALGPDKVTIELSTLEPAVSPLQILLVALTAFLAAVSALAVYLFADPHYSSSLLANLITTTLTPRNSDHDQAKAIKPQYLRDCPEINLARDEGAGVVMATESGAFRHVRSDRASPGRMPGPTERLMGTRNSSSEEAVSPVIKTANVREYEVQGEKPHAL